MLTISSFVEFQKTIALHPACLFYFSHEKCNVCKVLLPKIENLFFDQFPKVKTVYSDIQKTPELAAQNRVFVAPTILIYFEGQEYFRFARNISMQVLQEKIERPYSLLFS